MPGLVIIGTGTKGAMSIIIIIGLYTDRLLLLLLWGNTVPNHVDKHCARLECILHIRSRETENETQKTGVRNGPSLIRHRPLISLSAILTKPTQRQHQKIWRGASERSPTTGLFWSSTLHTIFVCYNYS